MYACKLPPSAQQGETDLRKFNKDGFRICPANMSIGEYDNYLQTNYNISFEDFTKHGEIKWYINPETNYVVLSSDPYDDCFDGEDRNFSDDSNIVIRLRSGATFNMNKLSCHDMYEILDALNDKSQYVEYYDSSVKLALNSTKRSQCNDDLVHISVDEFAKYSPLYAELQELDDLRRFNIFGIRLCPKNMTISEYEKFLIDIYGLNYNEFTEFGRENRYVDLSLSTWVYRLNDLWEFDY